VHLLGHIVRVELLHSAPILPVADEFGERARQPVRQRGDGVVFPDVADEADDLGPRQRLDIGLRRQPPRLPRTSERGVHRVCLGVACKICTCPRGVEWT
jgi:hypothetical protein